MDQPDFRRWFGDRAFQVSDASVRSAMETVVREWAPDVTMASPPCQPYSTADMQGATKAVAMIPLVRDHLTALGGLYAIENVKGASREMGSSAVLFYGAYFGERVDRPRFFEANFPLVANAHITPGGGGQQVWAIYMEVDATTSFQREVSSSGSVQNAIFCIAAERSRTSLTRALVIDENTIKCAPHIREKGQQVLASDMEVEQVMRLGFRCDESVYTSVRGRQERPRGPPMAHMDYTNIYAPRRVRVIRF